LAKDHPENPYEVAHINDHEEEFETFQGITDVEKELNTIHVDVKIVLQSRIFFHPT
jgi:hypothetical protein